MDFLNKYLPVAMQFCLKGDILSIEPYGEGHINLTLLVTTTEKRYIMQKMNTFAFPDSDGLMSNICGISEHLTAKGIETLTIVKTTNGQKYLKGIECYRVYDFIEGTVTYQKVKNMELFKTSGKGFGDFQNYLADYDATKLIEPIKQFHNTPKRYRDFIQALNDDLLGRKKDCEEEIRFILNNKDNLSLIVDALNEGSIPLRVTHNDTKLNNILLDAQTNEVRAVIDFDTIMPGAMMYDFGDSIRFGASTCAEDEKDLDKVHFDINLFTVYAQGFCSSVKDTITKKEAELLAYGAYLMTIECGMRFLTDYLVGDTYFATKYLGHNLVRCRTQFKLAREMWNNLDKMNEIVFDILYN